MPAWSSAKYGLAKKIIGNFVLVVDDRIDYVEGYYVDSTSETGLDVAESRTFPAGKKGIREAKAWLEKIAKPKKKRKAK